MTKDFLTQEQVKTLRDKEWTASGKTAYLTLYQDDFEKSADWEAVCDQLGVPYSTDQVDVLYIGVKTV